MGFGKFTRLLPNHYINSLVNLPKIIEMTDAMIKECLKHGVKPMQLNTL